MYFWKYNKKYTWKQISYPVIQMYVRVDILVIYYIFFNFFLFYLYCPIQWKNYYVNQLYTVIFLLIILLIVGVLIDNKAFVCLWCMYADFKHLGDQNHREKSCYVASEFIALSLLVGIC
jgi:hypothetical protein